MAQRLLNWGASTRPAFRAQGLLWTKPPVLCVATVVITVICFAGRATGEDLQNDHSALFARFDFDGSRSIDRDELSELLQVCC